MTLNLVSGLNQFYFRGDIREYDYVEFTLKSKYSKDFIKYNNLTIFPLTILEKGDDWFTGFIILDLNLLTKEASGYYTLTINVKKNSDPFKIEFSKSLVKVKTQKLPNETYITNNENNKQFIYRK